MLMLCIKVARYLILESLIKEKLNWTKGAMEEQMRNEQNIQIEPKVVNTKWSFGNLFPIVKTIYLLKNTNIKILHLFLKN